MGARGALKELEASDWLAGSAVGTRFKIILALVSPSIISLFPEPEAISSGYSGSSEAKY